MYWPYLKKQLKHFFIETFIPGVYMTIFAVAMAVWLYGLTMLDYVLAFGSMGVIFVILGIHYLYTKYV